MSHGNDAGWSNSIRPAGSDQFAERFPVIDTGGWFFGQDTIHFNPDVRAGFSDSLGNSFRSNEAGFHVKPRQLQRRTTTIDDEYFWPAIWVHGAFRSSYVSVNETQFSTDG